MQWLTGRYDGYGIVEHDSGDIEVFRHNGVSIGVAGSFDGAVELMENDE